MGSIPGVRAARRALPDTRWGPAVACSSRRGFRAARAEWRRLRLPQPSSRPVLPFASGGAFHLPRRRPQSPGSDTLRQALGTERELFVSPTRPKR